MLWQSGRGTVTRDYCRECRKSGGCEAAGAVCPEPKLLPDAEPGVTAYLVCSTQWRVGAMGRTGLDYTACRSTLADYLPRWQRDYPAQFAELELADLMSDLQTIEAATLAADGELREAEQQARGTA